MSSGEKDTGETSFLALLHDEQLEETLLLLDSEDDDECDDPPHDGEDPKNSTNDLDIFPPKVRFQLLGVLVIPGKYREIGPKCQGVFVGPRRRRGSCTVEKRTKRNWSPWQRRGTSSTAAAPWQ